MRRPALSPPAPAAPTPYRRLRRTIMAAVAVLASLGVLLPATGAYAAGYIYLVGHSFLVGGQTVGNRCTGAYAVTGASGMFVTTAGHCSVSNGNGITGEVVYGATRRFGVIIRNDYRQHASRSLDAALIKLDPGDDAYQIVVDPVTGRSPGSGRVRGYYANSALRAGLLIGKMGFTTGWTEGTITGWYTVANPGGVLEVMVCTTAQGWFGDSGGPVWRNDSNGVMAIGLVKAVFSDTGEMCFTPIETILRQFGATLPVFTTNGAMTAQPEAATVVTDGDGPPLPYLTTSRTLLPA